MEKTKATIEVLNDLIEINNDRIVGYERAIRELKDEDDDLKVIFLNYIDQSRKLKLALGTEVQALGKDMDTGTTNSGKIYRAWMDVKAIFTGNNRRTVLANCEFGEDAAQKAYNMALESDKLPDYLMEIITKQQLDLKAAHDEVKAFRNQES